MVYIPKVVQPKKLSMSLAAQKLSPETLSGLVAFYSSDAMSISTDFGSHDPAVQLSKWVRECLSQKKPVAEKCIQRMLWHYNAGTFGTRLRHDGCQYIVGLMQFDATDKGSSLSREQESAVLKLEMALNSLGQKSRGVSLYRPYGIGMNGARLLYERLGDFVIDNPERIDDICWIITNRDLTNLKDIKPLLETMSVPALYDGVL